VVFVSEYKNARKAKLRLIKEFKSRQKLALRLREFFLQWMIDDCLGVAYGNAEKDIRDINPQWWGMEFWEEHHTEFTHDEIRLALKILIFEGNVIEDSETPYRVSITSAGLNYFIRKELNKKTKWLYLTGFILASLVGVVIGSFITLLLK
jgi:hypothetical protein